MKFTGYVNTLSGGRKEFSKSGVVLYLAPTDGRISR